MEKHIQWYVHVIIVGEIAAPFALQENLANIIKPWHWTSSAICAMLDGKDGKQEARWTSEEKPPKDLADQILGIACQTMSSYNCKVFAESYRVETQTTQHTVSTAGIYMS